MCDTIERLHMQLRLPLDWPRRDAPCDSITSPQEHRRWYLKYSVGVPTADYRPQLTGEEGPIHRHGHLRREVLGEHADLGVLETVASATDLQDPPDHRVANSWPNERQADRSLIAEPHHSRLRVG